jgi:hypothetical protein
MPNIIIRGTIFPEPVQVIVTIGKQRIANERE